MPHVLWVNGCPSLGGGEIAQIAIFREVAKTFDVSIVMPDDAWTSLKASLTAAGITRQWQRPLKRFERTMRPIGLASTAAEFASRTRFLVRLIKAQKIDLIHAGYLFDLPYCSAAATICGIPLVWLIENPERFDRFNRIVISTCRLDAVIGTSSAILNAAVEAGLKTRITAVAGNPYDDNAYVPSGDKPRTNDAFVVGFAGVFGERKGVLELCRAYGEISRRAKARGLKRMELHLVGGGDPSYVDAMKGALSAAGVLDEVRFLGHGLRPPQMCAFYQSLDLYIMLSKREGMSVAMLEAMASGAPSAILSPWGDDAVLPDETGVRLPSDEPGPVADALMPVIENAALRSKFSAQAVEHLRRNFAPSAVAGKLLVVYDKLLSKSRKTAR